MASILKTNVITLPTKVHIVKTMVCPIVMDMGELDHKEAECPRTDAFKL